MQNDLKKHEVLFTCPSCGSPDYGKYCSHCGHTLKLTLEQVPNVLTRLFLSSGYSLLLGDVPASREASFDPTIASWIPADVVASISETLQLAFVRKSILLGMDRTNIKQAELMVLIGPESIANSEVTIQAAKDINVILTNDKELLRKSGIKSISLVFCTIYTDGVDIQSWKSFRLSFPRKLSFHFNIVTSSIGISLSDASYYPQLALWLDPEKLAAFKAVLAQYQLESTLSNNQRSNSFWSSFMHFTIEKPTEELRKLLIVFVSIIINPMRYAREIDAGRLSFKTALSYLLFLVIVDAAVDKATGLKELTPLADLVPIGGELLLFLLFVLIAAGSALLIHLTLKAVGGKGTFQKTFLTQIILMVVFVPIATVVDVGAFLFDAEAYKAMSSSPGSKAQNGLIALYYLPMLSVVHKISKARVGWSLLLLMFVAAIALAIGYAVVSK